MNKQAVELARAEQAVRGVLAAPDWDDLETVRVGHLWRIGGTFRGDHHGTADADPGKGAKRLDDIARATKQEAIQPSIPLSLPPSNDLPSGGDAVPAEVDPRDARIAELERQLAERPLPSSGMSFEPIASPGESDIGPVIQPFARLSEFGPVGTDKKLSPALESLREPGESLPAARIRLNQLLITEKAELRRKRDAKVSTDDDEEREAMVDRWIAELAELGAM